ncbi:aminoglycoside phosphotransferase family protein [Streptomyces sp. PTM05]|uniref:Aminoglycoside phosphotransferase family protein n=1 Tax=Streptantibioticus parmotrematis TaxID=2873249 RepID=A0ABS7QRF4_9ACTN|nr:aminoglycoside phosphotransferase family protein [Streptantibioticus parmotrematis]MBY8885771.1 aminoglycoside phosphotransferase family protein [Streptantibioticus parmotrematis]
MAFTEERARAVLARTGVPGAADARLLALGENAVFRAGDLVLKVGREAGLLARARREVRVATWLAEAGVPAVHPARPDAGLTDGLPVTYWRPLPEPVRPATGADLADLLRRVHTLPRPDADVLPEGLPPRDLLDGVERWLRLAGDAIDPADAAFLRGRRDDIALAVGELTPRLAPGPVHGDALPRNVLVGPEGPVLTDLETFADDLREHDLVVMALSLDRYGLDPAEYEAFTSRYGWDVREWDGWRVLRGARETASCAWVAQHAPGNPAARAEFTRRVASLRADDPTVRWHAF